MESTWEILAKALLLWYGETTLTQEMYDAVADRDVLCTMQGDRETFRLAS